LIEVDRVRQEYDDVLALDGISFTVGEGEAFGFLGDEGAGKSTILRLLAGRLTPTSGSVRILGRDAATAAEQSGAPVSLVLDENMLCAQLSGRITLFAFARLYGVSRTCVSDVLALVGLEDAADRLVEQYSPGMRRRLMVARALLTAPRVLCVDEPTRDLDLGSAREVCAVLGRLNAAGIALVLTMRDLDATGQLCHAVMALRAGSMTALDRPRSLRLRSAS
jgi:ABC-2 type transport system ATP-binding protein